MLILITAKAAKPQVVYVQPEPNEETNHKESTTTSSKVEARGKPETTKASRVVQESNNDQSEVEFYESESEPEPPVRNTMKKKRKRSHHRVKKSRRAAHNESAANACGRSSFFDISCAVDEADSNATMLQMLQQANKEKLKYKYYCLGNK